MAHKKAGGSSRNGRDSHSKRLGVKRFGGQEVKAGNKENANNNLNIDTKIIINKNNIVFEIILFFRLVLFNLISPLCTFIFIY